MRNVLQRLWHDDQGALLATEWVFIATILVIGLVAGLKSVQQAAVNELEEVASAIGALDQTYSFGGTSGCCGFTAGSSYRDEAANRFDMQTCTQTSTGGTQQCAD